MKERGPVTKIVRALRGGQITIPAEFRRRLGITEDSVLQMILAEGELRIKPMRVAETAGGSPWLKELYDLFAPVRDEAASMSEEEIDEAIQQAVAASRNRHG